MDVGNSELQEGLDPGTEKQPQIQPIDKVETPEDNKLSAYIGSEYLDMIRAQEKEGREPAVLFTDVDDTFVRSDSKEESKKLFEALQEENYPIVAVTGRRFEDVEKRIKTGEVPEFQVIASSVGTEIWVLHKENGEDKYIRDEAYEQQLQQNGFDRQKLAKSAKEVVDEFKIAHPQIYLDFQRPEEEKEYSEGKTANVEPFKISFQAFASTPTSLDEIRTTLEEKFPRQSIVISEERDPTSPRKPGAMGKKYNVDILPTTKAGAVEYISKNTGINIQVVAGDGANDADMLAETGDVSIVVGGATAELIEHVDSAIMPTEADRHFQRVKDENGNLKKLYYREKGIGKGPESIKRAIKYLKVAQKVHQRIATEATAKPS